ncbi:M6PR [Mytilus edulis]|uniref:M6PR n=1 Tax=Mytilus edulis TaxID=6550 RepID=A0A8S3S4P7_MYTED|nr:M6PR [Mytilus edulis]
MNKRLQPLLGRVFETREKESLYTYNIGICVNVDPQKKFGENVGVVQIVDKDPRHWVIGYYNNSQLIEGIDWLILEYLDGQKYGTHCGKEHRKARIMIKCDRNVKSGVVLLLLAGEKQVVLLLLAVEKQVVLLLLADEKQVVLLLLAGENPMVLLLMVVEKQVVILLLAVEKQVVLLLMAVEKQVVLLLLAGEKQVVLLLMAVEKQVVILLLADEIQVLLLLSDEKQVVLLLLAGGTADAIVIGWLKKPFGTIVTGGSKTGADWVILEYLDGQKYGTHCGKEPRKARIMITCDSSVKSGEETVKIFEEETDKSQDCYYLFEISSPDICIKVPPITISLSVGSILVIILSVGSILVIIFIVVVCLYILLGFLYNRLVLGAKGKEQIPNYSFWQDFGNLQADGCNYICRTGIRSESKPYKGLGDDQLQEEDDRDDHLLPM